MAELPTTAGASDYKFDVAFSFLKEDEGLAVRLGDLIQDRLRTFIYSKKQEYLAGRDGEETFNAAFGRDARLVVILYREAWGSTSWTRIERDAIRNRAFGWVVERTFGWMTRWRRLVRDYEVAR